MKKMLFLHAGAELYGADIVLLELIKGLNKDKYEPFIILPNDGELVDKLRDENINVIIENYPILRRKYFNVKGIINYCYNYKKYSKKIVRYIEENKIDIVHINTSAVLEGCYIKKKTGVRVIWHIHEILLKPKIISKFIYKAIAKYADEVICVSNAVKKHFEEITKRKNATVIYNGVDNKKFNSNINSEYLRKEFKIKNNELVIGMIGRINAWKGQEDFIDAMEIVLKEIPNARALIVGGVYEGQEWRRKELEDKIKKSIYYNRITMSDFRKDSPNIHNLIDIFVLPSTNPDPLPTVILEAMACGKPVVAYRHGGVCEMVVDGFNGYFANVRDINDMASKIIKIANDENIRKKMGENAVQRQRTMFSLESYIDNFEKIYNKGMM